MRGRLIAFNNDGSVRWRSSQWALRSTAFEDAGAVAVGDINLDGDLEIVFGDTVFSHKGEELWHGDGRYVGSAGRGRSCFADVYADVEGLELVAGPRIFAADGDVLRDAVAGTADGTADGIAVLAVLADLDGDGVVEVVVRNTALQAFSTSGEAVGASTPLGAALVLPTRSGMGASCPVDDVACKTLPTPVAVATIDDVVGDELVVTSGGLAVVYGFVERRHIELDDTDAAAAPTAFDIDNDGRFEIIVADSSGYRIFDAVGERARVISASTPLFGGVVVADVDGDGSADLVRMNALPFSAGSGTTFDVSSANSLPRFTQVQHQAEATGHSTIMGASAFVAADDDCRTVFAPPMVSAPDDPLVVSRAGARAAVVGGARR